MKTYQLFALLILPLAVWSQNENESGSNNLPPMLIEMDQFGFPGDLNWISFEKMAAIVFQEQKVPFSPVFEQFPVKDAGGSPVLELTLKKWRLERSGEREILIWAVYVAPDGKKTDLGLLSGRDMAFDVTYDMVVRHLEKTAKMVAEQLVAKLEPLINPITKSST